MGITISQSNSIESDISYHETRHRAKLERDNFNNIPTYSVKHIEREHTHYGIVYQLGISQFRWRLVPAKEGGEYHTRKRVVNQNYTQMNEWKIQFKYGMLQPQHKDLSNIKTKVNTKFKSRSNLRSYLRATKPAT